VIIDHDTMTQMGPTDETMPLRVIQQAEPAVDYPVMEKRMQWAGPFPVRPVRSMTGRLSLRKSAPADVPDLETFAREAPIEDVVEAVKILSSEDTATHALPAVEKLTGAPSTQKLAHRSAAHVQRVFNEAGWPIAVWYGEATKEYWVMDESGLHSFESVTAMYQGMGWEAL
jgi:hypothetical protein